MLAFDISFDEKAFWILQMLNKTEGDLYKTWAQWHIQELIKRKSIFRYDKNSRDVWKAV